MKWFGRTQGGRIRKGAACWQRGSGSQRPPHLAPNQAPPLVAPPLDPRPVPPWQALHWQLWMTGSTTGSVWPPGQSRFRIRTDSQGPGGSFSSRTGSAGTARTRGVGGAELRRGQRASSQSTFPPSLGLSHPRGAGAAAGPHPKTSDPVSPRQAGRRAEEGCVTTKPVLQEAHLPPPLA